jgi:nickel/cobalt exporter
MRRTASTIGLTAVLMLLLATPAVAHPLGNFTINTFSRIQVSQDGVTVDFALDMAEIPTFQLKEELGLRQSVTGAASTVAEFFGPRLLEGIDLLADGQTVDLRLHRANASFTPGQGGLDILRVDARFRGRLPSSDAKLVYEDDNFAGRLGWHEVVVRPIGGQGLVASSAPSRSISDGLREYPRDLLSDPLDTRRATFTLRPGAGIAGSTVPDDTPNVERLPFADSFASLIEADLTPTVIMGAVLLALLFGAVHALGPGHGKAVMSAYLVSADGRARQAVLIGAAVSAMHTTSVVVLGLLTIWASSVVSPEQVYPWLSLVSGLVVLGLGSWLLRVRLRASLARRGSRSGHPGHDHHRNPHHNHAADETDHARAHALGLEHSHGELPSGTSLLSWRGMGAIALSGGLLPSPSALVVLLGAVALHRIALGIVLVASFSLGLAAALAIVGIVVLKARDAATRRGTARIGRVLPLLSAAAIVVAGMFLTAQAAVTLPL